MIAWATHPSSGGAPRGHCGERSAVLLVSLKAIVNPLPGDGDEFDFDVLHVGDAWLCGPSNVEKLLEASRSQCRFGAPRCTFLHVCPHIVLVLSFTCRVRQGTVEHVDAEVSQRFEPLRAWLRDLRRRSSQRAMTTLSAPVSEARPKTSYASSIWSKLEMVTDELFGIDLVRRDEPEQRRRRVGVDETSRHRHVTDPQ